MLGLPSSPWFEGPYQRSTTPWPPTQQVLDKLRCQCPAPKLSRSQIGCHTDGSTQVQWPVTGQVTPNLLWQVLATFFNQGAVDPYFNGSWIRHEELHLLICAEQVYLRLAGRHPEVWWNDCPASGPTCPCDGHVGGRRTWLWCCEEAWRLHESQQQSHSQLPKVGTSKWAKLAESGCHPVL